MIDVDGLPTFPPLPAGAARHASAGSLLRLFHELDTAALELVDGDLRALVLLHRRNLLDAYLERQDTVVTGLDVLDHLDGVSASRARVYQLPEPVLRLLSCYWRVPTRLRIEPGRWLDAELLIRSLARPGQRGVACVRGGRGSLGLVLVDGEDAIGGYRADGDGIGGLDEVLPLFEDERAALVCRLEQVAGVAASGRVALPS